MYTPFLFSTSETDLHYVLLHKKEIEAFPMHWHDEIEVTLVKSGVMKIFINEEPFEIKAGEAVIINSGDCHYTVPTDAETVSLIFSPSLLSGTATSDRVISELKERLGRNSKSTLEWKSEDRTALLSIFSELEILEKDSFSYELLVRAAIFRLCVLIGDERHNPIAETSVRNENSKTRDRIANVFRYIEEHYMNPLSLPEAAEASGYVPTYFSRVFKTCTGMTFYDYLTIYRIRKAEVQLVKTNDSISKIASASGFSSVKTFDRVFKEQVGISPLRFRKQHQCKGKKE